MTLIDFRAYRYKLLYLQNLSDDFNIAKKLSGNKIAFNRPKYLLLRKF